MTNPLPVGGLIQYLNASPGRRGSVIQRLRMRAQQPYKHYQDYWLALRQAVGKDRRTTRDGAALEAAATNASASKKPHYAAAASAWPEISKRWSGHTPVQVDAAILEIGGLEVKITPTFAEEDAAGRVEVVLVWFNDELPSDDVVAAVLRLMQRSYPEYDAVFVDVRRKKVRSSQGRRLEGYDSYLESEAAGLAHLLAEAA